MAQSLLDVLLGFPVKPPFGIASSRPFSAISPVTGTTPALAAKIAAASSCACEWRNSVNGSRL